MSAALASVPYPIVDPEAFRIGDFGVRWYGISYVVAFALAAWVLRGISKRGRWPVHPDHVLDVLFWGILGVWFGGRIGYMLFYAEDKSLGEWVKFRDGGMSFHGGLGGVVLAYVFYAWRRRIRFRDLGDGLALATPLGVAVVRLANFINAELWGREWDGPWAMNFPIYRIGQPWDGTYETRSGVPVFRHPSQLYEMLGEGVLTFFVLRYLMLRRGWGGGRIGCAFLVCYGVFRFGAEFFREPDKGIGFQWLGLTRGQEFCALMIAIGLVAAFLLRRSVAMATIDWAKAGDGSQAGGGPTSGDAPRPPSTPRNPA